MEENKKEKMSKKKKLTLVLILVLVMLFIIGLSVFIILQMKKTEKSTGPMENPYLREGMGENVISSSGLTAVGMSEESLELDFLETKLYVEDSFLSTGNEVEAGTIVFRISDESLEDAKRELENTVTEAELNYRQGLVDYETSLLEAKKVYETAEVNRDYAQAEYDKSANEAQKEVASLEEEVESAREQVEEYERSINEDYYRTYYRVDELYQNYYEHFTLLMEKYEEWNIENLKSLYGNSTSSQSSLSSLLGTGTSATSSSETSTGSSTSASSGTAKTSTASAGKSENEQKLSTYNLLDELVQQEAKEYKEALKNYENARKQAEAGIEEARSNLTILESELVQAQTAYEKELIQCKADYETTLAECDNAGAVYDTTCQSLEEALEELLTKKEEAEENLTYFEENLGDGSFYTTKAGTIVVNAVRKGSYLSGDTMVIAYSNPETVTISANVDQSDIAKVSVGDEALAVISEYGNYKGTVTTINPVTQANSRSSVTYQVTITLEGDISGLDSNLTASVYLGLNNVDEMLEETEKPENVGERSGNAPERRKDERKMEE